MGRGEVGENGLCVLVSFWSSRHGIKVTYGVLGLIGGVRVVRTVATEIRVYNNSDSLLVRLALAIVVSRAPESSISAFPALGFDCTNSRLLLRLFRPPLMVAEDLALTLPSTSPASFLVVKVLVLVLLNDAAQSRAGRRSRSAHLLGGRVEELLRRRRASDSTSHLTVP